MVVPGVRGEDPDAVRLELVVDPEGDLGPGRTALRQQAVEAGTPRIVAGASRKGGARRGAPAGPITGGAGVPTTAAVDEAVLIVPEAGPGAGVTIGRPSRWGRRSIKT